jgi:hypothetical protein
LRLQEPVLCNRILVPQQQLLVHGPGDVRQDACPLRKLPLPRPNQRPMIDFRGVTKTTSRATSAGDSPPLLLSFYFLTIRPPLRPTLVVAERPRLASTSGRPIAARQHSRSLVSTSHGQADSGLG